MIRTPKPICRHPLENTATLTLSIIYRPKNHCSKFGTLQGVQTKSGVFSGRPGTKKTIFKQTYSDTIGTAMISRRF